jgi:AraC family transcriptional activator of mtrCDE
MRHSSDASCRYMHFHNCLEIGYCYCGGERLSVNDEEHFIFGGDAMMTLPYTPHRSDKFNPHDSDRAYCEYLYIDAFRLLTDLFPEGVPRHFLFDRDRPGMPRIFRDCESPEITSLIRDILHELRLKPANYKECVKGLTLALLMRLSRRMPDEKAGSSSNTQQIYTLFPAISYLNNSFADRIKVDNLHQLCYISATHFRRLFSSVMGCSPLEYLQHLRINKACDLLYSTDSILNIALAVGFDSISSFNRQFIKATGMTPSGWRKQRLAAEQESIPIFPYDISASAE